MYLSLIILPLLGSIFSGLYGRKIGIKGSQIITTIFMFITTFISILIFIEVGLNNIPVYIKLARWVDSESIIIYWSFNFDSLTVSMLIPILIISSLVHLYSIEYMSHDPHNQRFFCYLSLFTFMMILLVTADNFLVMFIGWEGVGICSYLLVNFWYTRIAANQSSLSAILTNRVGDCFLSIGMFLILWSIGNIDYASVFAISSNMSENVITLISLCLLIGAIAKSSQIGLHIWLPMAMEGPTPVSALIHAATMVTAGVYLLIRISPILEYSSTILLICLLIGAITTLFSSLVGLFQQDIKKIIAYSTMSQLGLMVIAIGLSSYNVALFHLINHAFYKGLLFLVAGSVIHTVSDNQDIRKYGGLKSYLPLSYSAILTASLSLIAFPFMTGFYSKDLILEQLYGKYLILNFIIYYIAIISAIFTTLYSVKIIYLTFLTNPNGPYINYKQIYESNLAISIPLILLSIFSIIYGYITKDIYIGLGTSFFNDNSIFMHPNNEIMINVEFSLNKFIKLLPFVITIILIIISLIYQEFISNKIIKFKYYKIGYNIFNLFNLKLFWEFIYNKYIIEKILKIGGQTIEILDKGSLELIGPYGLEKYILYISSHLANLDIKVITTYVLYIIIGFIFYILISFLIINN